jgi:hypothetical protein
VGTDSKESTKIHEAWSKLLAIVSNLMISHGESLKKEVIIFGTLLFTGFFLWQLTDLPKIYFIKFLLPVSKKMITPKIWWIFSFFVGRLKITYKFLQGFGEVIFSLSKTSWKKSLCLLSLEAVLIYKGETVRNLFFLPPGAKKNLCSRLAAVFLHVAC